MLETTECPANRTRHPSSFPQTLRVDITASLADNAMPRKFHQHQLKQFECLELSPRDHFILIAAVMYSQCHHWVYVHCHFPIIVDDERSRAATSDDRQTVAKCACILFYGRQSESLSDSSVTSHATISSPISADQQVLHSLIPTASAVESVGPGGPQWQTEECEPTIKAMTPILSNATHPALQRMHSNSGKSTPAHMSHPAMVVRWLLLTSSHLGWEEQFLIAPQPRLSNPTSLNSPSKLQYLEHYLQHCLCRQLCTILMHPTRRQCSAISKLGGWVMVVMVVIRSNCVL
jgi:hypothetical protein